MRLFLAINLPPAERRAMYGAIAPMRRAAREVGWVDADRLHLTMKFFGERRADDATALAASLAPAVGRHAPPMLRLGGLGAFPNLRAPRVVWLGVEHDPRLELLQHDVESTCAALGYALDARAFRPHITLGRVRDRLANGVARALADAARTVHYRSTVRVDAVDLMASELGPGGSRYTVVSSLVLGGE